MKLQKVARPAREQDAAPERDGLSSSSAKILNILDLFSVERPNLHVQDVASLFAVSQSTAYRYLKELSSAGFLAQLGKGHYSLGPKIVELERLLRLTDPLFVAGTLAMSNLESLCDNRALLLCTLYGERVLCIHKTGAAAIETDSGPMPILRDRGTPFPLFLGAGSLAILAHLPAHAIKSLYLANQEAIAASGLGTEWKAFRDALARIRKHGYATHTGRINTRMFGVAVPIVLESGEAAGSLLILTQNSARELAAVDAIVPQLQAQASAIGRHIAVLQQAHAARES